jgi:hypothetical protein
MIEPKIDIAFPCGESGGLSPAPGDRVVDKENHHRSDHGHEHTVEVEAGHPRGAELREEETANDGANDTKNDVSYDARARLVNDLAADETGDEAEKYPAND